MIGDKYRVKEDCVCWNEQFKKDDILIEKEAYNFETETYEDGGEYNELHNEKGYVCDVGSPWAKENLERIK